MTILELDSSQVFLPSGDRKTFDILLNTDAPPGTFVSIWAHSENKFFRTEPQKRMVSHKNQVKLRITNFSTANGFDTINIAYFASKNDKLAVKKEAFSGQPLITRNLLFRTSSERGEDNPDATGRLSIQELLLVVDATLKPAMIFIRNNVWDAFRASSQGWLSLEEASKSFDEFVTKLRQQCFDEGDAVLKKFHRIYDNLDNEEDEEEDQNKTFWDVLRH